MRRRNRVRLINLLLVPLWLITAFGVALWSAAEELFKRGVKPNG